MNNLTSEDIQECIDLVNKVTVLKLVTKNENEKFVRIRGQVVSFPISWPKRKVCGIFARELFYGRAISEETYLNIKHEINKRYANLHDNS